MIIRSTAIAFLLATSAANAGCFIGGSAGVNINTPSVSNGVANLGINTQTVLASPEVGCDRTFGGVSLGALARYNIAPYAAGNVATFDSLKSSGSYSLLGKVGVEINRGTEVYAVAGLTGKQLSFNAVGTSATGTTLGAGMEVQIAKSDWSMFGEFDTTSYAVTQVSGASVKPNDNVFRVGVRFRPSLF